MRQVACVRRGGIKYQANVHCAARDCRTVTYGQPLVIPGLDTCHWTSGPLATAFATSSPERRRLLGVHKQPSSTPSPPSLTPLSHIAVFGRLPPAMASHKEAIVSSPTGTPNSDHSIAYYKSQYEQLEAELADFQASSKELETELEKDVEAAEQRERQLKEKVESLGYEVEEWKVSRILHSVRACNLKSRAMCASCRELTIAFDRPNTSNPKLKQTPRRTSSRRKLRPCAMPTELCSYNCAILRYQTMTLNDKQGTQLHH